MSKSLPPYPTDDLRSWAFQMVEYLLNRERNQEEAIPFPVPLQHKIGDERAFTDGTLMFDPMLGQPVVSINGEWVPVTTQTTPAVTYTADVSPLTLTGTYQTVTLTNPIVLENGTYLINTTLIMEGTGGNASYQGRVLLDGVVGDEGPSYPIGNGEINSADLHTHVSSGSGQSFTLELRGNNCDLTSGKVTLTRVGA